MKQAAAHRLLPLAAGALVLAALPAGATSSAGASVRKLMRPTPEWYTPDLHQRVLAAGARGVPLPDGVQLPAAGLAFTGIRPGAWMLSPAWCTMNFVFGGAAATTSGKGGGGKKARAGGSTWYIGTAGHCTEKVGDEVVLVTLGPTSPSPVLVHIGNTVKTTGDAGIGNDFALVAVKPELNDWVSPAMAHWGGPTGAYTGTTPLPLVHSGHGLVIGTGGTGRAGQTLYLERDAVYWIGATMFGDSGSGVNTATGLAQSNITHLVVDTRYPGADSVGTSIAKILQLAGVPLATCPVNVPWPGPGCPPG